MCPWAHRLSDPTGVSISREKRRKRAEGQLDVDDETQWDVVYCDGACKKNGTDSAVAGVGVWWGYGDIRCACLYFVRSLLIYSLDRNISERCPGLATNNRAELYVSDFVVFLEAVAIVLLI